MARDVRIGSCVTKALTEYSAAQHPPTLHSARTFCPAAALFAIDRSPGIIVGNLEALL